MKVKLIAGIASMGMLAGLLVSGHSASAQAPAGPIVVMTDPAGDWGTGQGGPAPGGAQLGQDLLEASMQMSEDGKSIEFILKVSSLPPTGGMPEVSRYVWDILVDGKLIDIDGKFTNLSRGVCDPTAGCPTNPPPRNPAEVIDAPFAIRGDCMAIQNQTVCQEKGLVHGTFEAGTGLITVPVPLELLGAVPGSVITGGATPFMEGQGANIGVFPSVFVSNSGGPKDIAVMTGTFVVPGGKKPKKGKKGKGGRPTPTATPSPSPTD
ncbi:MAG: hypothetical protein ABR505_00950 [Actinomycetota bacterium]